MSKRFQRPCSPKSSTKEEIWPPKIQVFLRVPSRLFSWQVLGALVPWWLFSIKIVCVRPWLIFYKNFPSPQKPFGKSRKYAEVNQGPINFSEYGTTSTPYYFHTNAIGLVTAATDADGNIVESVDYDLYGMPTFKSPDGTVLSKSSIGNNILFQGREYDEGTNLYYYRARYYDPIMGRFL
jgi:RHS repeat-associated protein